MAAVAAAKSVLRSPSLRGGAARMAAAASRPPLSRVPSLRPAAAAVRFLRSPVEASFCIESLMPMHTATASALMTSMLGISRRGYVCLSGEHLIAYMDEIWIMDKLPKRDPLSGKEKASNDDA